MFSSFEPGQTGSAVVMLDRQGYKSHQLKHTKESIYHAAALQTLGLIVMALDLLADLYKNYQHK